MGSAAGGVSGRCLTGEEVRPVSWPISLNRQAARESWSLQQLPTTDVMQAAQHGMRDELPNRLWLDPTHWLARDSLSNSLVRSRMIEVPLLAT